MNQVEHVNQIGEWIADMINGGQPDQNWLAIEKHFKRKLGNGRPGAAAAAAPVNHDRVAATYLKEIWAGRMHASSTTAELLEQILATQASAPASESAPEPPHMAAEINDLRGRLGQTSDWRFRLETSARKARATLRMFADVARRAPSEAELRLVIEELDRGIDG